jgi:flavin-binding protein dodecin
VRRARTLLRAAGLALVVAGFVDATAFAGIPNQEPASRRGHLSLRRVHGPAIRAHTGASRTLGGTERRKGGDFMAAMVKVIEVLAQSEKSWDDAAKVALEEASKTLRGIQSIYVKDMQAVVEDNRIVKYRLNAKISFLLERED